MTCKYCGAPNDEDFCCLECALSYEAEYQSEFYQSEYYLTQNREQDAEQELWLSTQQTTEAHQEN